MEEFNQDKNVFQFFIDEEEKVEIVDKFQIINEHLNTTHEP
jgi:hypothetical protein